MERTGLHLITDTGLSSVSFTNWLTLKSQPQVLSQIFSENLKLKHTDETLHPIPVLAELHVDLEVDDRRVAELERLEST